MAGLLRTVAMASSFAVATLSADAFISVKGSRSLTDIYVKSQSVTEVRVEKISPSSILYRKTKDIKGKLPKDFVVELIAEGHSAEHQKALFESLKEGTPAVVFRIDNKLAICNGNYWSVAQQAIPKDKDAWTVASRSEPWYYRAFFGTPKELVAAVKDISTGKEIEVPVMLGGREDELQTRSGKIAKMKVGSKGDS